ncbi:hypothetical protein G6L33_22290 [Agrobacterium rhizogenes]|nr:hypothetical protein [Rhizobium rhizogenes]NTH66593.1 hypothetical protein [Rhizobium rhizogenes]
MSDQRSIYERIVSRRRSYGENVVLDAGSIIVPLEAATKLLENEKARHDEGADTVFAGHAGAGPDDEHQFMAIAERETDTMKTRSYPLKFLMTGVAVLGVLVAGVVAGVVINDGRIDLPGLAQAAEKGKTESADQAKTEGPRTGRAANAAGRPVTLFDEHIGKAGLSACKEIFPLLGLAATSGSAFSASSSWNETEPSAHAVQSLVGMTFNTDVFKGNGASVVYSAPVAGKCEGLFVRVVPIAQDCKSFQATLSKESKLSGDLGGTPLISLPSGWQTMLVPSAGNGCVVITTTRAAG